MNISNSVKYIGVDDTNLDLFESQYAVPKGISYNSYVILDEKIAVLDTVDKKKTAEWEAQLLETLQGRTPDYLVIHHLEPDHAGSISRFMELFPETTIVGNAKTFLFLPQYFEENIAKNTLEVKEGDGLSLGTHELCFYMAHMIHWPEVMVSYEKQEKILFSADGFGKFGALSFTEGEDWTCEARRYYFNIVGKYGMSVQALLGKLRNLELAYICPLHGPVLCSPLTAYVDLYDTWSSYQPETEGVLIAYASIHGNTGQAAKAFEEMLREKGVSKVVLIDLARTDISEAVEAAFRYDRMVLAAASYDGGVFPCMHAFLHHLQCKLYQNRRVGIIENGTWAPSAGRCMRAMLESMKKLDIVEPMVTIRSTLKSENIPDLNVLAEAMK